MIITEYLSSKLRWLSVLMTVLVVIIHAFIYDYLIGGDNPIINNVLFSPSVDMGRTAVPLFFLISGLLFFKEGSTFTFDDYKSKVMKRVKTLLVPYLLFSAFMILLVWLSWRDFVPNYLHLSTPLPSYSLKNILIVWLVKPQAFHLWFIRNLFLLALLSPIIFLLIKKGGWYFISFIVIIWLLFQIALPSQTLSIVFFSLGAFISIKGVKLPQRVSVFSLVAIIIAWIVFVVLDKLQIPMPVYFNYFFMSCYTFIGLVIAWLSYDFVSPKFVKKVNKSKLAHHIFFVYLVHVIFIDLFRQTVFHFAGRATIDVVLPTYYISIVLSIVLSVLLGMAMEKITPRIYNLMTGSR